MKNIKAALLAFLLSLSGLINAAESCATNTTELRNALDIADGNNEHDVIKIAQGNYATNGSQFNYNEFLGWDLEITGGWSDLSGNPCGQQFYGPSATTLDGTLNSQVLNIILFGNASLKVSNLSFLNGSDIGQRGGGLEVRKWDNLNTGKITIENNAFLNNYANFGSAMSVSGAEKFYVRNNLFSGNTAITRHVISIVQNDAYGTYFTNNTVMFNDSIGVDDFGGVYLAAGGTSKLLVANNIMLENGDEDLFLTGAGDIYLKHNNVGVVNGNTPVESFGNFNLPPQFELGDMNFTPSASSPLVNAGVKPCTICQVPRPFDETWSLGSVDLTGDIRDQNGKVDIGAIESSHYPDLIFLDNFE